MTCQEYLAAIDRLAERTVERMPIGADPWMTAREFVAEWQPLTDVEASTYVLLWTHANDVRAAFRGPRWASYPFDMLIRSAAYVCALDDVVTVAKTMIDRPREQ